MMNKIKIEIEIPEEAYKACLKLKSSEDNGFLATCLVNAVANGTLKSKGTDPIKGYKCDPKKNKECKKTACYAKGGPCSLTLNPEYAKED